MRHGGQRAGGEDDISGRLPQSSRGLMASRANHDVAYAQDSSLVCWGTARGPPTDKHLDGSVWRADSQTNMADADRIMDSAIVSETQP